MAGNGVASQAEFAPVLSALATMSSTTQRAQKKQAHEYLESFQKSAEAWQATGAMLQDRNTSPEAKLFAATTLKGKITYDVEQIPRESLPTLRDSILSLLVQFRSGPKPVRTQLCVCLATLTIQMVEWKNPVQMVVSTLGSDPESGACVLEYLKVLPEEVTEGRRINLTDEQLEVRTKELLDDNADKVQQLLARYAQSSASAARNPQLLDCITSWLREIGTIEIVKSPLLDIVMNALSSDDSFDSAVECLCTMFKDTKEVDEYMGAIQILYPQIMALKPRIAKAAAEEDLDTLKGITRIYAEAGEAWVILIARLPVEFRDLVGAVLECCAVDRDREAISITFNFWYELKLYIVLEKYMDARLQFVPIYSTLVDVLIKHLEFPIPESGDQSDLFDGDREQEDKFREFRHAMGDVLKDCCEVLGVTDCLGKAFALIQKWVTAYGPHAAENNLPHWQELEAPLFSMRSMGRMVDKNEDIVLPQVMPLIIQIPFQEKVRFQSIMALGRYTEWVAEHPKFLDSQLQFIITAFDSSSAEVVRAAALALRFYCVDCAKLLTGHIRQLQQFYEKILSHLVTSSQEEITEGMACVISVLPPDQVYENFKLCCDPVVKRLMARANAAQDEKSKLAVADDLQLISIFIEWIRPVVSPDQLNPAVKYCQEIFPVLAAIAENFLSFPPICERVCRCWRRMVLSYRTASSPLLGMLAEKLAACFAASRLGCFLWVTDAILREFSEGAEFVSKETSNAIYAFFEQQATSMLRALNDLPANDLPDVIEDFFRLLTDAILYYPFRLIPSALFAPIFSASLSTLSLEQAAPLTATLHYLRDALEYGGGNPPMSQFDEAEKDVGEIRQIVQKVVLSQGDELVQRILTGMMFSFPKDCFPDASGVLLALVEMMQENVTPWIANTLSKLPAGTFSQLEAQRLLTQMSENIRNHESKKVRYLLQDFTNSYRRRNVAPRDGLGRLEPARFRFKG